MFGLFITPWGAPVVGYRTLGSDGATHHLRAAETGIVPTADPKRWSSVSVQIVDYQEPLQPVPVKKAVGDCAAVWRVRVALTFRDTFAINLLVAAARTAPIS